MYFVILWARASWLLCSLPRILLCLGFQNLLLDFLWLKVACIWWLSCVQELVNWALRCFVPTKRTLRCSLSATKHWKSHFHSEQFSTRISQPFFNALQWINKFKQSAEQQKIYNFHYMLYTLLCKHTKQLCSRFHITLSEHRSLTSISYILV